MIVLDFVGDRHLSLPREENSDPRMWSALRAAAGRAGVARYFPAGTAPAVLDDHIPFARQGIPAIDLIDFDYPCFHRRCDTLAHVSARSLDAAAAAVAALARGR